MGSNDNDDDELWSAIADPSRRRLLDLLIRGEGTASSLAHQVPFTRQAVAKHLAVLEQAGLVTRHPEGREIRFRVNPDRLDRATRALAQLAREWDGRLMTIKRLAEAAHQGEAQVPAAATRPDRDG
jgi:ArsR family transcriptional regulator, cadmium/lead-responsive transcriptional repressor